MARAKRTGQIQAAESSHAAQRPGGALARSRSLRSAQVIPNSSEQESDSELNEIVLQPSYRSGPKRRRILKEVAIPSASRSGVGNSRRSMLSTTSRSSNVSEVSANESFNEYDTPETSVIATPADTSFVRGERKLGFRGDGKDKTRLAVSLAEASNIPNRNTICKRKRGATDLDCQVVRDEQLAKKLQEQEYAQESVPSLGRAMQQEIVDSEDLDLTTDSDYESESSLYSDRLSKSKFRDSRISNSKTKPPAGRKKSAAKGTSAFLDTAKGEDDAVMFDDSEMSSDASLSSIDNFSDDDEDGTISSGVSNASAARGVKTVERRLRRVRRGRYHSRAEYERARLEEAHPEIRTLWEDLKKVPTIKPEARPQPAGISRQLKAFQLEGLDWMIRQEQSQYRGGLLGDEMGMGKTIQAVSLIMSDYPAKEPSLVVVPPVALMQWSTEIATYTDGKLKVLVHHNTDPKIKKLTVKDLKKYDVVMISYSGLESIHRKETKGWKRDDGLVKENSRIHAIHWHRLILDEAHSIKSRTTGVAKACFALKADYKWCLSGTPVQNRIGEFFSLLRFLGVKPFASYFCKTCSCAHLSWSQDEEKKCTHCGHSGFQHISIFNQELLQPITSSHSASERKEGLAKLRLLTDRIMLRRMKRDHTASMELPPKEVIIHNEFFGEKERDFSSSIMTNTNRQFDTYVSRGVMLNNYANIFGLIMQMRQVANHPDLILKKHANGGQNVLVCNICDETAEEPIRSRCNHEFCRKCAKDYIRSFESGASGQPDCPKCHIELSIDFEQPDIEQDEDHVKKSSIINRIKMEDWTSSTKIEMLIYDLYKLRKKSQTHKSIVFSQFTSMLQLVEWRLRRAGFNTVMLDGSMTPAQRQKSIEYFMNNVDVEVFLVSLKAGGVALNLTEASRVFIIDPWWNPAAEWQSADRCHRIGQRRPCSITRLCVEDSVESRIVQLQEKKARLIATTVNNDDVAMEKLTPEDMQFLFRGT